ncbi:MAG: energy coupling factor transporter S component ThiW [Candidatus Hodarchaeota archaeon]
MSDKTKEKIIIQNLATKKIATSAIFTSVGIILSHLNPFIFIPIIGAKIFPFAHFINAITGVLIGILFSSITALGIAILRFSLALGTIHAFHGHLAGAIVVSTSAYILWRYKPKHIDLAALTEPLGTVFIAGTIAEIITPVQGIVSLKGLLFFWGLFTVSSVPGCVLGYLMLKVLRRAGISRVDFIRQLNNESLI